MLSGCLKNNRTHKNKKQRNRLITLCIYFGGQRQDRTADTRIFSPLLYRLSYLALWLRGLDLNQRPSGYEPDELPSCSTPRQMKEWHYISYTKRCQVYILSGFQGIIKPLKP